MAKYKYKGTIYDIGDIENINSSLKKVILLCKSNIGVTAFQLLNKQISLLNELNEGQEVEIQFFIDCKQWNGKWFTNLNLVSIKVIGTASGTYRKSNSKASVNYFEGCRTKQGIKSRYRELCKRHHPDKGGDENIMKEINNQYDKIR